MDNRIGFGKEFSTFTPMRFARLIIIFLTFSVVLSHSLTAHHHHTQVSGIHHHDDDHEDGIELTHSPSHSVFTFAQIDETFVNGKQIVISIAYVFPAIFKWSFTITRRSPTEKYFEKNIVRPPIIWNTKEPFRGPPIS